MAIELVKKQGSINLITPTPTGETIDKNLFANALNGTVSGTAVAINDASPFQNTISANLKTKNLLDYTKVEGAQYYSTVELIPNGVKATGTNQIVFPVYLPKGKSYVFNATIGNITGDLESIDRLLFSNFSTLSYKVDYKKYM
jgi:hypothetical protein